jgi:hypothetical protein
LCIYKSKKLRQKANILTVEQSKELAKLVGLKSVKNVTDQGITPTHLFRLRKRKLELIYHYLNKQNLIHDKEPSIESLQTHQLGEYLSNIIYPGYPACKAKNLAYADYRECREREIGQLNPLAYDFVPTTEIFDRLDEIYRLDIDWYSISKDKHNTIQLPISTIKKSIERIKFANYEKSIDSIEYHLYLWNSTRTLLKPHCKSLKINLEEVWTEKHEKTIMEGFMHINITEKLKQELMPVKKKKSLADSTNNPQEKMLDLKIELNDNEEFNISHISLSAVTKKSTKELICELYLQSTTECIMKAIRKSQHPLDTQQIIVHLLRQYHEYETIEEKLKNAENIFMTCKSNTYTNNDDSSGSSSSSSSEEDEGCIEEEQELVVSLVNENGDRLAHPIKSVHCKHRSCFEASDFFDQYATIKIWHCPICQVHIKGFEELRADYSIKVALNQYPELDELYIFKKTLLSENQFIGETSHIITELSHNPAIILLDDDDEVGEEEEETSSPKRRRRSGQDERTSKRYRATAHVV